MRFIGSKVQILDDIDKVIKENNVQGEIFLDIFSGTGSVARKFKNKYTIYSNDFLYFSYVIQKATVENNRVPKFDKLNNILDINVYDYLQDIEEFTNDKYKEEDLFLFNNFSHNSGRQYFTDENARRLDLWRLELESWYSNKYITEQEYFYLLACIIETVPFYSNISGTYGAYLKSWDPRALKRIQLKKLDVIDNGKSNKSFNEDSENLIKHISGDILYIDPPYNERQYLPNYHVLETIAKYDYPQIKGVTGIRDYSNQKSRFSRKKDVYIALEEMISNADFEHVILSYSTDGIMEETKIKSIFEKYSLNNECKVYRIPKTRYKSRKLLNNTDLYELIFYIRKYKKKSNKAYLKKSSKAYLKSPLNYIGGKGKILDQIIPLFPNNISSFVDLFAGGYNVGLNVKADKIIAVDINKYVIEMYQYFKENNVKKVLHDIHSIISAYSLSKTNKEGYLKLRENYNLSKDPVKLFVLIAYSFNHQIRFNNSFQFNNPFGLNRSSYNANIENNLVNFINRIQNQNVIFDSYTFNAFDINQLDSNSFVYCDPPYFISTGSYNDGTRGFGNSTKEREEELLNLLDQLNNNNIRFALSNFLFHKGKKNIMLANWAYKYKVHKISSNYNNSNYQSKAKENYTEEVLITNY